MWPCASLRATSTLAGLRTVQGAYSPFGLALATLGCSFSSIEDISCVQVAPTDSGGCPVYLMEMLEQKIQPRLENQAQLYKIQNRGLLFASDWSKIETSFEETKSYSAVARRGGNPSGACAGTSSTHTT